MVFCEFFRLISSFNLFFFNKVQFYLLVFCKLLPNLYKSLVLILCNLNISSAFYALSFFYHRLADTKATDNIIVATLSAFQKKASKIKNKHLCYYAQMLTKDLETIDKTYLRNENLISNASVT